MKKFIALIAAVLVAITAFPGCKTTQTGELEEFRNRPKEVVVYYSYNAYGKNWITEVAKKYMTDYNTDTYINLKKSLDSGTDLAKVESGVNVGDLYILDMHMEGHVDYYEDITDVYDSYPIGEDGQKKIIDKLDPAMIEYYRNSGAQNYIIPKSGVSAGNNYVYNKTILEEIYPDGYTLPRTTDEFIEMGNYLKNNTEYYLIQGSIGDTDSGDYINYMHKVWFAQLIGHKDYEQFLSGRYFDATTQKYLFDEANPTAYSNRKEAVKDYYEIIDSIYAKANGYMQPDSGIVNQATAQLLLAGLSYGDYKTGVFLANGSAVEMSMDYMLAEQESSGTPQELGMLKIPMASEIIKRTPSIKNDIMLREVIDYVDKILLGESATKPANVTDADITIIEEARSIIGSYVAGGMIVPKLANNKEGAKDFIRYLASDEAQIIAAKECRGVNVLPFGKDVSEEELGFTISGFRKEVEEIAKKSRILVSSDSQEFLFTYMANFDPILDVRTKIKALVNGTARPSSEEVYTDSFNSYKKDWNYRVKQYTDVGGSTAND